MKKITTFLCALLFLEACSSGIKGNEYQLQNSDITLSFSKESDRFFGRAVNRYFGTYKTDDDGKITLSAVGATMMAGSEEAMKEEQTYFLDLAMVKSYALADDKLTLTLEDGKQLSFYKVGTTPE
ncbi:MAG: META domain-containing protein [Lactobacillales bacterium]|jgi:heat shock protein HslJ|nr:META domain-containing protein [Lactobacillales bacterium]